MKFKLVELVNGKYRVYCKEGFFSKWIEKESYSDGIDHQSFRIAPFDDLGTCYKLINKIKRENLEKKEWINNLKVKRVIEVINE